MDKLVVTCQQGAPTAQALEDKTQRLLITIAYQDELTRAWAATVCARVTELVGGDHAEIHWWHVPDAKLYEISTTAIKAAAAADIIVVSVYGENKWPVSLCAWVDHWVALRTVTGGTMLALVTVSDPPHVHFDAVSEYLRAVADKAHLEFCSEFRKHPASNAHSNNT